MRHYYKVIKYSNQWMCSVCEDSEGRERYIDLSVEGKLPEGMEEKELVGSRVSMDYEDPFITIGIGVKIESTK